MTVTETVRDRSLPRGAGAWIVIALGLCLLLALSFAAIRYLAPMATYSVGSGNMEPTLSRGDIVLSNGARALCGRVRPHPGDIVVFWKDGATHLSRAMAGGGHTIALDHGVPIIDGQRARQRATGEALPSVTTILPDGQIREETLPGYPPYRIIASSIPHFMDTTEPVRVPDHHWFVLGDNRNNSVDSRFYGPVPDSEICGTAVKIVSSPERSRIGGYR